MGKEVAAGRLHRRIALDEQRVIDRQKLADEVPEVDRVQVARLTFPLEKRKAHLGAHQVDLGGAVFLEEADVFLVLGGDRVLEKDHEKDVVELIFLLRDPRPRLELALLDEGVADAAADEVPVGIDERVLDEELVEVVAQELVVGTPQPMGEAELFAEFPVGQRRIPLGGDGAARRPD